MGLLIFEVCVGGEAAFTGAVDPAVDNSEENIKITSRETAKVGFGGCLLTLSTLGGCLLTLSTFGSPKTV